LQNSKAEQWKNCTSCSQHGVWNHALTKLEQYSCAWNTCGHLGHLCWITANGSKGTHWESLCFQQLPGASKQADSRWGLWAALPQGLFRQANSTNTKWILQGNEFKGLNLYKVHALADARIFSRDFNTAFKPCWYLWRLITVALVRKKGSMFFFSWFEIWRKGKMLFCPKGSYIPLETKRK